MKYRMYIDEVGNSDIGSSDNPNHRFLSLTGVICSLIDIAHKINPEMELLKKKFFDSHPDDPVVFHRKEMMNKTGVFSVLTNQQVLKDFDNELLDFLSDWKYTVITVCIDKKAHKDTYTSWRYDPYHYCLAILLERYVLFLERNNFTGDVMAESRGGKEDIRLKKSFHGIWTNGTEYISAEHFQKRFTSCQLKVKPKSANISGLQLSDLLAHPSRSEILHENNLLGRTLPDFGSRVIDILQKKYDTDNGKCYGKKFLK